MSRRLRITLGGWCCWLAVAAWAAPEQDHQRGVLAYNRGDVVGAMSALRPAAQAGHAPSQSFLAFILDRADFVDEAFGLYRDAAAQNDQDGLLGLANCYLTGRGVAKDEKLALQQFSKAADLGNVQAIWLVAEMHLKGQFGLDTAPAGQTLAALRRAADKDHLPSIDALMQAYRNGRFGLPVDAQQATLWQTRGTELRAKQAGRPATAKASR